MGTMRDLEPAESDVLDTSEAGGMVVRGGTVRIIAFAATALLSLLGVVVITRYLNPDRFGQYQTVISLMIVIGAVSDLGMATLGAREFAQRSGDDRRSFMQVLLGLRLTTTVLGIAFALAFAIAAGYSQALVLGTVLASVGLLLTVVQTTLAIPLGVELKLGKLAAMDVVRQGLTTALLIAVVVAGGGVTLLLAVVVPVQLALVAWTYVAARGAVPLAPSFNLSAWRGLVGAAAGFALAMAAGTIYQYLAQILTSLVAGETQTGLFSAAFRVYMVAASIPGLIVASAFPVLARAARDDSERLRYALSRLTQATLIAGGASLLFVFFCAGPVIDLVGGPEYREAVPVLRLLTIAMLVAFAIASWGFALLALHLHRPMVIANLVSLAVTAGLVFALASSSLGARGTAIAAVAGELFLAAGYLIGLRTGASEIKPFNREAARTIAAIAGAAVVGAVTIGLGSISSTALALVAYGILLVVLRAIPREMIHLLPASVRDRVPVWMTAD